MKHEKEKIIYKYTITDQETIPLFMLIQTSITSLMLDYICRFVNQEYDIQSLLLQRNSKRNKLTINVETPSMVSVRYINEIKPLKSFSFKDN